jgi:hypothetical protein
MAEDMSSLTIALADEAAVAWATGADGKVRPDVDAALGRMLSALRLASDLNGMDMEDLAREVVARTLQESVRMVSPKASEGS